MPHLTPQVRVWNPSRTPLIRDNIIGHTCRIYGFWQRLVQAHTILRIPTPALNIYYVIIDVVYFWDSFRFFLNLWDACLSGMSLYWIIRLHVSMNGPILIKESFNFSLHQLPKYLCFLHSGPYSAIYTKWFWWLHHTQITPPLSLM